MTVFAMSACTEENNELFPTYEKTYAFPTQVVFTELDQVTFSTLLSSEVVKVDVETALETIIPTTYENNVMSYTSALEDLALGLKDPYGQTITSIPFNFLAIHQNGNVISHTATAYMVSPIEIELPTIVQANLGDHLAIKLSTANAKIDTKEVYYKVAKVGQNNDNIPFEPKDLWVTEDSLSMSINGAELNIGDTVWVQVATAAGERKAYSSTGTIVEMFKFNTPKAKTFNGTNASYSMWTDSEATVSEANDLQFVETGFQTDLVSKAVSLVEKIEDQNYNVSRKIEFVASENTDLLIEENVQIVKVAYNEGVATADLLDVKKGDWAIFRMTKTNATDANDTLTTYKYGIIEVTAEDRPSDHTGSALGNTISISYKAAKEYK